MTENRRHVIYALHFAEARGKVPYMPFVRAPYYQFIGRKKA